MNKVKLLREKIKGLFSFLVNDPSYHYYYTEPVDKRGSTTYPPDDRGPSDLAIYGTIAVCTILLVRGIRRVKSNKRTED